VEDALAVALLKGKENGTAEFYRTDPDIQTLVRMFSVRAKLWPGDAGEIIQLPVGPESNETARFATVYNMLVGGKDENPDIVLLEPGDELIFTGKNLRNSLFNGRWRVIATPLIWVGGQVITLDTLQFKVERVSDD
jgi:hypothetical protein